MLSKSWWKNHFDPVRKRSKWSLFYHMTCFKSGSYMSGSKYIFDPLVKSSFYGSLIYKTIFLLRYWSDAVEISRWSFPPMLEHIFFQLPPDFWSIQLFLFLVLPSAIEFLLPNLFDIFQLRSEPHFLLAILQSPTVIAFDPFSNLCFMADVGTILKDSLGRISRRGPIRDRALIRKHALLLQLLLPHWRLLCLQSFVLFEHSLMLTRSHLCLQLLVKLQQLLLFDCFHRENASECVWGLFNCSKVDQT